MPKDKYYRAFDERVKNLDALFDSAKTIIQVMKNTANAETRGKQLFELRAIDANRVKLLDEMDALLKAIQAP